MRLQGDAKTPRSESRGVKGSAPLPSKRSKPWEKSPVGRTKGASKEQRGFTVHHTHVGTQTDFDETPECRCFPQDPEYACLLHWDEGQHNERCRITLAAYNNMIEQEKEGKNNGFPTTRRVVRRQTDRTRSFDTLMEWAKEEGITLGEAIPDNEARLQLLQLIWTYRDVGAKEVKEIPATDLTVHRIAPRDGLKPYKAFQKRFANDKEWWLRKIVERGMEAGHYERCTTANGRVSQWNARPVMVNKEGKAEPRLTFNYHFVYEDPAGSHMELAAKIHDLLGLPNNKTFFQADIKHGYWAILVHPADGRHFLAFSIPGIGQLQPTRMPQGTRTSSFTFTELEHYPGANSTTRAIIAL